MRKKDKNKNKEKKQQHPQHDQPVQPDDEQLSEEIQQQLENLREENADMLERLQRISADYANYQKRVPKQVADTVSYEREKIMKSLLPAMDNFEHVLANAGQSQDAEDVIKGVRIVYDQMCDILKSHGVEQIDAKDQPFDPALHQAMMRKEEPEQQDNVVLEEFQRGYIMNDRVLRPSKVVVNKAPACQQQEPKQDETDQ